MPPKIEAYQVHVGPMRATSRGWVKLQSKDPKQHPIIQPNYLDTEQDRYRVFPKNSVNKIEMFYLNTIEQLFLFVEHLFQLKVCLPGLLAGIPILAVFKNLRWNSNKTSLIVTIILFFTLYSSSSGCSNESCS